MHDSFGSQKNSPSTIAVPKVGLPQLRKKSSVPEMMAEYLKLPEGTRQKSFDLIKLVGGIGHDHKSETEELHLKFKSMGMSGF